jgi:hypothetical protein
MQETLMIIIIWELGKHGIKIIFNYIINNL